MASVDDGYEGPKRERERGVGVLCGGSPEALICDTRRVRVGGAAGADGVLGAAHAWHAVHG